MYIMMNFWLGFFHLFTLFTVIILVYKFYKIYYQTLVQYVPRWISREIMILSLFLGCSWLCFDGIWIIISGVSVIPMWISLGIVLLIWIGIGCSYLGYQWIYKKSAIKTRQYGNIPSFHPILISISSDGYSIRIFWSVKHSDATQIVNKYVIYWKKGQNKDSILKTTIEFIENNVAFSNIYDLEPNTEYFYHLPDKEMNFHFSTPPRVNSDNDNNDFQFTVVSDLHADTNDLGKLVSEIQSKTLESNFLITAGDNIAAAHKLKNWWKLWNQISPLTNSQYFLTVPGNHDGNLPQYQQLWKTFLSYDYPAATEGNFFKFVWGNTIFFFIDLYNNGTTNRIPSFKQVEWLKIELAAHRSKYTHCFLVMHNSIYCTGEFGSDPDLERIFLPIIEQHHIDIVISGHAHIFEAIHRTDINPPAGTLFLVVGGAGTQLDHILLKKFPFPTIPYRWKKNIHSAQEEFYQDGNPKSKFRNDDIIRNYQEWGQIIQHFLHISIKNRIIHCNVYDLYNNVIYSKLLKK